MFARARANPTSRPHVPTSPDHCASDEAIPESKLLQTPVLQPHECMIWAELQVAVARVHRLELSTVVVLPTQAATFKHGPAEHK